MQPVVPNSTTYIGPVPITGDQTSTSSTGSSGSDCPDSLIRPSSLRSAHNPASIDSSYKMAAGHSVSLSGQAANPQIPKIFYQQTELNKPMVAAGTLTSVGGVQVTSTSMGIPALYSRTGGDPSGNPSIRIHSGAFRRVAPYGAAGTVNQDHIRSEDGRFSQEATLTRAGLMQSSSSLYASSRLSETVTPLPTRGIPVPDRGIPVPDRHGQKPYTRSPVGTTVKPEVRQADVQKRTSSQGSITRGTPIFREQRPCANRKIALAQVQGRHTLPTQQPGHDKTEAEIRHRTMQEMRPVCIHNSNLCGMYWMAFMRNQFASLEPFLNYFAALPDCVHVQRELDAPRKIHVNIAAYHDGQFPELTPYLAECLINAANLPNYPFVQWRDNKQDILMVDGTGIRLVHP